MIPRAEIPSAGDSASRQNPTGHTAGLRNGKKRRRRFEPIGGRADETSLAYDLATSRCVQTFVSIVQWPTQLKSCWLDGTGAGDGHGSGQCPPGPGLGYFLEGRWS